MKTITTFFTLLMISIMGITEAKASQLYLRTSNYGYVQARISGATYYSSHGEIRAANLRPGRHFIHVMNQRGRRGRMFTVYRGSLHIPNNSTIYARLDRRGRMIIERTIRHRPPRRNPRVDRRRNNPPIPPRHRHHRDYRKYREMNNSSSFHSALQMVHSASFESEKLAIAKQYVSQNTIHSDDILALMNAFDFESTKLQFAKYAYDFTIDPENYFVVNKAFDFSSSVIALNKYIS